MRLHAGDRKKFVYLGSQGKNKCILDRWSIKMKIRCDIFENFYSHTKIPMICTNENLEKTSNRSSFREFLIFPREFIFHKVYYDVKRLSGRIDRERGEARWHRDGRLREAKDKTLKRCMPHHHSHTINPQLLFPLPPVYSEKETLYQIISEPWDLFDCIFEMLRRIYVVDLSSLQTLPSRENRWIFEKSLTSETPSIFALDSIRRV